MVEISILFRLKHSGLTMGSLWCFRVQYELQQRF